MSSLYTGWQVDTRTGYTFFMDAVRFGRALGFGARNAAKAAMMAADAAVAPRPAAPQSAASHSRATASGVRLGETAARTTAKASAQVRVTTAGLSQGTKRFGEAAWRPFVRLSGVLWLELTGVFFGLFLLTAGMSAWKLRANLHETAANHVAHQRLLWSIAMAVVFGYFCLSSFVRAWHRERRRS